MMKAKSVCPAPVVVSDYFFKQLIDTSLMEINAPICNDEAQHDNNEKPNEEEWQCNWKCASVTNNRDVNHVLANQYTPLFYKKHMNVVLSRENKKISELEKEVNEMWERVKEVQRCNAERRAFFSRFTNSSSSNNKNITTKDQRETDDKENIVEELREQIQKHYTMWTSHVIAERFNLQLSCNTSEQLHEALKEVKQHEHNKQEQEHESEECSNANSKMNNSGDLHIAIHFRAIDKNYNKNSSSSKYNCTKEEQEEYQEDTEKNKAVTQPLRLRRLFTPLLQRSRDEFATNLSLLFGQLQTFQRNSLSELQSKLSQCTMFDIPLHVVFDHIASYIQRTLCPLSQNDYDYTLKEQTRLLQAITQMQNKRECFLLNSAHESAAHCNNNYDTLHKWSTVLDQYNTTHVNKNSCNKGNDNTNVVNANTFNNTANKTENDDNNHNNNTNNVESDEECKTVFSEMPLSERYTLAEEMWQQLFSELDARKVFHAEGVNTFHEMYNSGKIKHNTMLEELHTCDKVTQAQLQQLRKEANECGRVIMRIGNELTPVIDEANTTYTAEFARLQNALETRSNMLVKSEKEQERLARRVREAVKDLYKEEIKYASLSQEMLQDQLTQVQLTESYHSLLFALTTCKDDAEQSHKLVTEVHHLLSEAETRRQELIEMCENHIARLTHDHYYTCGQLASLAERNCTQWEKCVQSVLQLYQRRFEKLSRSGTQSWQMEYLVSNEREFAVENLLDVRDEYAKYTRAWRHDMTAIFDMLNNQESNNSVHIRTHKKCNDDDNVNKVNDNVVNYKQIITQDVQRSLAQTHLVAKHNALQTVNDAENNLQTNQNKMNKGLEENANYNKLQRIMEEIDGHWRVQRANTTLRKRNKLHEKQKHDKENFITNTEESSKVISKIENTALNDKELKLNKDCNANKSVLSAAAAAGSGATAAVNLSKSGGDVKK